jgi:CRP-like cAMP-binding protein
LIFAEGDNGSDVLLITAGSVRLLIGDDHPLVDVGPGEIVGEFAALDGLPRSASAVARTPVELCAISATAAVTALHAADVDLESLRTRTTGARRTTESRASAAGGVPVSGVARLLIERRESAARTGRDDQVAPLQPAELAESLGCSREVLSRALDYLDRTGVVAVDRGLVVILDPGRLRSLGEPVGFA